MQMISRRSLGIKLEAVNSVSSIFRIIENPPLEFACGIFECHLHFLMIYDTAGKEKVYKVCETFSILPKLFLTCVCHTFASVHCCLVVTCWERADLLALVCEV